MTKFKKVVLASAATVMTVALAIGGTMAYLTSNDSDVNVMTLGNVKIEQLEYQRAEGVAYNAGESGKGNGIKEGDLVPFVNKQALYPAVPADDTAYTAEATDLFYWGDYVYSGTAGNGLWNDDKLSNVMDKMVFVKNTGKSDAYTRTLIAFECPEGTEYSQGPDKEFMMNTNGSQTVYTWENLGYIAVDGTRYFVMEATYLKALNPGNTAHPSLLQVVMTHNATNEDMELLGDTYEILVLSQAVQTKGFDNAATALETAFPKGEDNKNVADWFGGVLAEHSVDEWDGTADTSWYNDTDTEFVIKSAEQLAGFAKLVDEGNNFAGKTIKLSKNVNLEGTLFDPIGDAGKDMMFSGTFDGQNHTISGLTQRGWDQNIEDGLGLFAYLDDATIKNLNIDKSDIIMEFCSMGNVAAYAMGDCVFENISITNSQISDYQSYVGGFVGWASGNQRYINCDIDETNIVEAIWCSCDCPAGGMIGGTGASGTYYLEDCDVACVMDVYNDVCYAYQWYAYRYAGMIVGWSNKTEIVNGTTYAVAPHVTTVNCTVTYGDWANYTYCQFASVGGKFVREQGAENTNAYWNGKTWTTATDANGNVVVDSAHTHNDGEAHHEELVFDQLFGGKTGTYGTATHDGVTVIYNNK